MGLLERYTFERLLAERGAVVTRLMRAADGTRVVVKTLSVRRTSDAREIELFEREAGILKHLAHPAIPRFVDFAAEDAGTGDVQLHLVQSHVEGKSLDGWIKDGRSFTERDAIEMMRALADVLVTLHGSSPPLVHRDIKPSNVMRNDAGALFLVDFGAAKRAARDGTAVGTFGYMAPEQLEGRASPASDVFGVGMTMVHLLTHLEPEQFADEGGVRKAWRARANVSDSFAELINDCIAIDDERRPRDGRALRERIDNLGRARPRADATSAGPSAPHKNPVVPIAAVGALVVMLAGAGAATMMLRSSTSEPAVSGPVEVPASVHTSAPGDPLGSLTPQKIPPSARLGAPGLLENIRCASRANRALDSEHRYRSWRKGDEEPTCTERYVSYGLYSLYDNAPDECREAAAAAPAGEARDAAQELADALVPLIATTNEANSYYDAEDYKDDACAKGKKLHARLLPEYARVRAAFARVLAARDALASTPPPSDEKMAKYRALVDAALLVGKAARLDPKTDTTVALDQRKQALAAYEKARDGAEGLQAIGVSIEGLKKWARGSNDFSGSMSVSSIESSTASAIEMKLIFE